MNQEDLDNQYKDLLHKSKGIYSKIHHAYCWGDSNIPIKCLVSTCNQNAIGSHIFSERDINNSFSKYTKKYAYSYFNIQETKDASKINVYPCFCREHDKQIFSPIEGTNKINIDDPYHILLIKYKFLIYDLFSIKRNIFIKNTWEGTNIMTHEKGELSHLQYAMEQSAIGYENRIEECLKNEDAMRTLFCPLIRFILPIKNSIGPLFFRFCTMINNRELTVLCFTQDNNYNIVFLEDGCARCYDSFELKKYFDNLSDKNKYSILRKLSNISQFYIKQIKPKHKCFINRIPTYGWTIDIYNSDIEMVNKSNNIIEYFNNYISK